MSSSPAGRVRARRHSWLSLPPGGYATVEESARAIIRERLARGASRRPDALAFAQEILRRDIEKYLNQPCTSEWVFFDRGLIDALGMVHEASPLPSIELETNRRKIASCRATMLRN
jgi:predicted ATPase